MSIFYEEFRFLRVYQHQDVLISHLIISLDAVDAQLWGSLLDLFHFHRITEQSKFSGFFVCKKLQSVISLLFHVQRCSEF